MTEKNTVLITGAATGTGNCFAFRGKRLERRGSSISGRFLKMDCSSRLTFPIRMISNASMTQTNRYSKQLNADAALQISKWILETTVEEWDAAIQLHVWFWGSKWHTPCWSSLAGAIVNVSSNMPWPPRRILRLMQPEGGLLRSGD